MEHSVDDAMSDLGLLASAHMEEFNTLLPLAPICGNGKNEGVLYPTYNEPCDDGNTVSGDGCSKYCEVEDLWECTGGDGFTADTCTQL